MLPACKQAGWLVLCGRRTLEGSPAAAAAAAVAPEQQPQQQRFPLFTGANLIGRAPADEDGVGGSSERRILLSDATVSERHCVIEAGGPFARVRDLGSTNKVSGWCCVLLDALRGRACTMLHRMLCRTLT